MTLHVENLTIHNGHTHKQCNQLVVSYSLVKQHNQTIFQLTSQQTNKQILFKVSLKPGSVQVQRDYKSFQHLKPYSQPCTV